jgi:hypothetical protein
MTYVFGVKKITTLLTFAKVFSHDLMYMGKSIPSDLYCKRSCSDTVVSNRALKRKPAYCRLSEIIFIVE